MGRSTKGGGRAGGMNPSTGAKMINGLETVVLRTVVWGGEERSIARPAGLLFPKRRFAPVVR